MRPRIVFWCLLLAWAVVALLAAAVAVLYRHNIEQDQRLRALEEPKVTNYNHGGDDAR